MTKRRSLHLIITILILGNSLVLISDLSNVLLAQTSQQQSSDQDLSDVMDKPQTEKDLRDDYKMRLNDIEYKMKRLMDQFDTIQGKMDRLAGKVERLQRLENLYSRIDSLDRKVDSVENVARRLEQSRS